VNGRTVVLEETLIREAVSRIQKWLRKRGRSAENTASPRIAMKFCGGCNPEIDRGAVALGVREELAGKALWVPAEEEAEFVLIINGCRTACADQAETRAGRPAVVVSAETVGD
jgi:hypothetical protein